MKKILFCFMLSSFSFVISADKKFEQYQPKFIEPKHFNNNHYTRWQVSGDNLHTRNHFVKQRDYTIKTKRRSK